MSLFSGSCFESSIEDINLFVVLAEIPIFSAKLKRYFMKLNGLIGSGLVLLLLLFCWNIAWAGSSGMQAQDDPVEAIEVSTPPVIDGIADDACWEAAKWQPIDQTWIPWNAPLEPDDFTGRYKTVWSATQNLMYFAVEITDDVISDAFVSGQTAAVYNFDMIEVFIDEDKSGGEHRYDTGSSNAENAFAYHIFAKHPESGGTTTEFSVTDMAGMGGEVSYTDHFPDFALHRVDHVSTYEFSLIVYNDTYSATNKEGARVTLTAGMEMGLTLAANDDDEPDIDPRWTERDNMIGSVAVARQDSNNHWINADDFGTVKLVAAVSAIKAGGASRSDQKFKVFPNPTRKSFQIKLDDGILGRFDIKLYNLLGQVVYRTSGTGANDRMADFTFTPDLSVGMYFIEIDYNDQRSLQKVFLIR
jgi:hypothetical protein